MHSHNTCIYHCIKCGKVTHTESAAKPPQCCGDAMVNTCSETINEDDAIGDNPGEFADPKLALTAQELAQTAEVPKNSF